MTVKTLESIPQDKIIAAFNEAFSDYIIPLKFTPQLWELRSKRDRIDLASSYGYFEGDKICGFIFHGAAPGIWYNGGTGVMPSKRGAGITKEIYKKIFEDAPKRAVKEMRLEVITTNTRAKKIYEDIGFKISRELVCFKGNTDLQPVDGILVKENNEYLWDTLEPFWEYAPAWQLNKDAVAQIKPNLILAEAFDGGKKAGYIIYNPSLKQIMQFAADKNNAREKVFTALFKYIQDKFSPEISISNIDSRAEQSLDFVKKAGLKETIRQYEMVLKL